jgi:hypothetical protein
MAEMSTGRIENRLEEFLEALASSEVLFFPIRHHSPACAWHLRELIRKERPSSVLIEGPEDMTPLIPFILHGKTRTPIAAFTIFIDSTRRLGRLSTFVPGLEPIRFGSYYPFCDYSPELVALRAGAETGAKLRFIDLTYPEQILASKADLFLQPASRPHTLLDEGHLKQSAYLKALAKRAGCRDQNELWDHMFEANFLAISTLSFIRNVASYCFMSRIDVTPESLLADGTIVREQAMAAAVVEEMKMTKGKIVVVTGGFHTVALPSLIKERPERGRGERFDQGESRTVLMRYSFDQLDALNGYASGMPSPEYYQRLWLQLESECVNPFLDTASRLLVEFGRSIRKQNSSAISAADEIAALEQARRIAALRGHIGPVREDLLDAIRSCFVKGSMDAEGALLMDGVRKMLAGNRIGDLPPDTGVPPIVDDFKRVATDLRVKISDSTPKSINLDIYRKLSHRRISRFFHILNLLNVPFARLTSGPDFVSGRGLDRIQENWEYRWLPQTESTLIEQSLYGSTLEEAAINRLKEAIGKLADEGRSRSSIEAVRILVSACRMGLHAHTDRILAFLADNISEDPSFVSLSQAIVQLNLLWQSREPLEAHNLTQAPTLAVAAYRRACYLLPDLSNCPPEGSSSVLNSLSSLRELLVSGSVDLFDQTLFFEGLAHLLAASHGNSVILGGAAGILYGSGRLEEERLLAFAAGYLDSSSAGYSIGAGFIRGLLSVCREIAWNLPALLEMIDSRLALWSEEDFFALLPDLRLGFSELAPRETDRVGSLVAQLHGKQNLGDLFFRNFSEFEMKMSLIMNRLIIESLERDNLKEWSE